MASGGEVGFHEQLDLLVAKLRASHEAEMDVLRSRLQRSTSGAALCSQSSIVSLGDCPLHVKTFVEEDPSSSLQPTLPAAEDDFAEADEGNVFRFPLQASPVPVPAGLPTSERSNEDDDHSFSTRLVWEGLPRGDASHVCKISMSLPQNSVGGQPPGAHRLFEVGFVNLRKTVGQGEFTEERLCDRLGRLFMGRPTSPWRVSWSILGLFAIIYDLITIPLLVMEIPQYEAMELTGYMTMALWNLDIIATFTVSYHNKEGDLVAEPLKVAKHYALTWLPLDIGLVALDWTMVIMKVAGGGSGDNLEMGKMLRIARFLRILRLMRLLKVKKLMAPILDNFSYGVTLMYMLILKIVVGVLVVNHFMACFWYAVGNVDKANGWVAITEVADQSFSFRYLLSFHWCLSLFGVGASLVYPKTEGEFAFAIYATVQGLLIVSAMVSIITDAMLQLQRLHHEQSEQFSVFRRYCKNHHVSKDIFGRTVRYLEYAYEQRQKQTPASEIGLLALLSGPLRNELQLEIWMPVLLPHVFFKLLVREEIATMQGVCRDALAETHFAQEDKVFRAGMMADHMYFVAEGSLKYLNKHSNHEQMVNTRQWVSEAAVWTQWLHLGLLTVELECRLLALDVEAFAECVKGHPGAFLKVGKYAGQYVVALNKMTWNTLSDIDSEVFATKLQLSGASIASFVSE